MQTPLQLTFRGIAHSDALATHLEHRVAKLERLFGSIVSCHVVIELEGHHHRHGDRCRFTLHVGLPDRELLVTHPPRVERNLANADRAFDEAERQLEDWVGRQREHRHDGMPVST